MAKFTDKAGREWLVELDVLKVEEIQGDHGINLTDIERDPLLSLRNDPCILIAVVLVVCREQREQAGLTREQFIRLLPQPPDAILDAMAEAIINFFPSGRASHVREVLAQMEAMAMKTDEIAAAKLKMVISDPQVIARLKAKGDQVFDAEVSRILSVEV